MRGLMKSGAGVDVPLLAVSARVDWSDLPDETSTAKFAALGEGILWRVFKQRAAATWFGAPVPEALCRADATRRISDRRMEELIVDDSPIFTRAF